MMIMGTKTKRILLLLLAALSVTLFIGCTVQKIVVYPDPDKPGSSTSQEKRIELNVTRKILAPGESFALIASMIPVSEYELVFSYTSSDETIVKVDAQGVVTAVSEGFCTVNVRSGEISAVCEITVDGSIPPHSSSEKPSPSPDFPSDSSSSPSVFIPIEGLELIGPSDVFVGRSCQFTVKVLPENATEKYTLHNSNDRYCTMTEEGYFTATGAGITTITVETEDRRITDSITVTMTNYVSNIVVTSDKQTMEVGETINLYAEVVPGQPHKGVYWVFSEYLSTGKAQIKADGLVCHVTATKKGKIYITAGSRDHTSITKTYCITVEESSAPSITLDKNEITLNAGESATLTASVKNFSGDLTYTSSDEGVLTVDQTGKITALEEGEAVITVSALDGTVSAKCKVTVKKAAPEVLLDKKELQLNEGDCVSLSAVLKGGEGTLTYVSSDKTVATVDQTGTVTALQEGEAVITVSALDGTVSAECKVTVKKATPTILLEKEELQLAVGEEASAGATLTNAEGTLRYTVSAPEVLSINTEGKITALAVGNAEITVSFEGAVPVILKVSIVEKQNETPAEHS